IDLDAQGRPVVSTNDGLFLLDGGRFRHQVPLFEGRPQEATGLFHTAIGDLLGTEHGLYRYDLERNLVRPLTPPSTKGTPIHELSRMVQVRHAYADTLESRPCLVVGVMGYGTVWFEPATLRSTLLITEKGLPRSMPNNLTRELLRTRDGTYWSATPAGVFRWMLDRAHVENAFDVYRMDVPGRALPGNDVQDLLEDGQGGIWVATRDGGLALIRNGSCTAFPCPRPAGNAVFGLALDRRGRIWCTTANGIEVFDPADGSFFHVAVEGMQGSAALGGAIATLPDGRIGFIAENTFFIADPERMLTARPLPAPYLTGMRVDGRPAMDRSQAGTVRLSADEHALALAVSALRLTGPGPMSFAVRLEGVDEVPHLARGTDEVTYASLPPGDFRLFARSVDSSGALGEEVLLTLVHVAAPFWQRWWFYALLAVAASAGVLGWSRYRLRQALALHAVRDRIASDLHDEVGSSLSSITIGSQLAAQLSKGEDEQVRQLIARIGETSSASLRSMSDIVWAIDPKNDEGEALVKRLRRIAQELLESKGIGVAFLATGGVEELRLPMDVRKELLLIGKEAMHNVSKHAGAKQVTVTVDRSDGKLTLGVEDDGRGFDPMLHPDGHGLTSMQRRGAALGSMVRIDSAPGRGTRVMVRVDLANIRD
ncbi:MAG: ATP-binding protein, partial [Bacteroidetes bacterium]|nr:ATP-binding protein [Bacteroidota bacterium]